MRTALARPRHRWSYAEDANLTDRAATYLVGFSRSQGFRDGNKRTALAASLVFLSLNDHALHVPPKELYAVCMKTALGEVDDEAVARYPRDRIESGE